MFTQVTNIHGKKWVIYKQVTMLCSSKLEHAVTLQVKTGHYNDVMEIMISEWIVFHFTRNTLAL